MEISGFKDNLKSLISIHEELKKLNEEKRKLIASIITSLEHDNQAGAEYKNYCFTIVERHRKTGTIRVLTIKKTK